MALSASPGVDFPGTGGDANLERAATIMATTAAETEGGGQARATCGCGVEGEDGRKAVGVDPGTKDRNLKRLRRIEGQVRGLQRMVEEDRYCADILTQISSVHEALRSVGRELVRNHLKHCASAAIRGEDEGAEQMYDELVDMMYKHIR
jgi:DNA-binding FrmR family transcriptional regulator